ncbi:MAG TPA: CHAD domain-containing protein [Smithellaceae bacterium]|nr:CHAD domain-containing protein [Smithellaceae bacterium]
MSKEKKQQEIELKLVLPGPEAEAAVVAKMREAHYSVKGPVPVRNIDIYLDTFDWLLLKKKLALRYRIAAGKAVYTIKSVGEMEKGIAKRSETEIKLAAPAAVPADLPAKKIKEIISGVIYPRKLLEHIQIRTERRTYRVTSPEGAEIELAFDTSSFALRGLHPPCRAAKLQELEAEILKGPPACLTPLSALLQHAFGYTVSTKSKLEVAMERLKVSPPAKKPPDKLRIRRDDRLDLALRKIISDQFNRLGEQIPGVQKDIDTEFVHQARVSTRRMRSALKLFPGAIAPGIAGYLSRELKWLGALFGEVRDLDVFLLNLSRFRMQIERFPAKKKDVFDNWIDQHRRAPLKKLCGALESPRFANFARRLTGFVEGRLPQRPRAPAALQLVGAAAPAVIRQRLNAVIKQGQAVLAAPDLKQFHLLRIEMKKLRYACEFISPAYDGGLDRFINRTAEIQDCLGAIQDTVFTRGFIGFLFDEWRNKLVNPYLIFILGEIYQLQAEIAERRRESFAKIWEKFSSAETIRELDAVLAESK